MCISSYFLSLLMQSLHDNYVESDNFGSYLFSSFNLSFHATTECNE